MKRDQHKVVDGITNLRWRCICTINMLISCMTSLCKLQPPFFSPNLTKYDYDRMKSHVSLGYAFCVAANSLLTIFFWYALVLILTRMFQYIILYNLYIKENNIVLLPSFVSFYLTFKVLTQRLRKTINSAKFMITILYFHISPLLLHLFFNN